MKTNEILFEIIMICKVEENCLLKMFSPSLLMFENKIDDKSIEILFCFVFKKIIQMFIPENVHSFPNYCLFFDYSLEKRVKFREKIEINGFFFPKQKYHHHHY